MKSRILIAVCAVAVFCPLVRPAHAQPARQAFLGLTPPGDRAAVFAPGLVSTDLNESVITFSPDGRECYWSVRFCGLETILTTRLVDGRWSRSEVAPFSGRYHDGWPAIQPGGSRLFFHSSRPTGSEPESAAFNIWVIERTPTGWGEPHPLGSPVNDAENTTCPSVARNGNLYVSKRLADGTEQICRSRWSGGRYGALEPLPASVNAARYNFHGTISPDETLLVRPLHGRPDAIGGGYNYYVSFRSEDDDWSDLVNLGAEVNGLACDGATSFSADGSVLFFQAHRRLEEVLDLERRHSLEELLARERTAPTHTEIYWIDAAFIARLRPTPQTPAPPLPLATASGTDE